MNSSDWKSLLPDLPHDDDGDGDALRRLASHGSDLSKPMTVDFAVDVPNDDAAKSVAAAALKLGSRPHTYQDSTDKKWTCNCAKTIIPTYDEILAIQNQLDELSRPFGGKSDGWGSFGNAEASQETKKATSDIGHPQGSE
jgi:regulator of ribonuclease activity B